jgi:hypothetical protein
VQAKKAQPTLRLIIIYPEVDAEGHGQPKGARHDDDPIQQAAGGEGEGTDATDTPRRNERGSIIITARLKPLGLHAWFPKGYTPAGS